MKTLDAIKKLNDISAYQKGLFTTGQAEKAGVARHALSRLEKNGNIERLAKGVYRMGGAPSSREEDVLATWLSLDPVNASESETDGKDSVVAMGATAAWLQELGEIGPTPYEFCCARRKQTQRQGIILRKKALPEEDVTAACGIPVTTPARTILDLIDNSEDLSLVGSVLRDALGRGLIRDVKKLATQIDQRGRKIGASNQQSLFEMMAGGREYGL